MSARCPAHAQRSRAARRSREHRSPVLSSRWRLHAVLLLLLVLHITLFSCRAAKQLLGLLLAESALWLRRLGLRLIPAATAAATTTTPVLLLSQRELVVPLRIEVSRAQQN